MELPPAYLFKKYKFLSRGATGWVFKVDDDIALEYAQEDREEMFNSEVNIYDILERHKPCPYIMQSFLRRPRLTFLEYMSGGSLDERIKANQSRDKSNRLLQVIRTEPLPKIEVWVAELTNATAWLESLGLVHGDLRPTNMLLDAEDHLKLIDFDCTVDIGSDHLGHAAPWARVQGEEAGDAKGTFGLNGPRTEQFAVGSVIYTMTRGFEPYEFECDGPKVVDLFRDMKWPELDTSSARLDSIIYRCWTGAFATMKALSDEAAVLVGSRTLPTATKMDSERMLAAKKRCIDISQEIQAELHR